MLRLIKLKPRRIFSRECIPKKKSFILMVSMLIRVRMSFLSLSTSSCVSRSCRECTTTSSTTVSGRLPSQPFSARCSGHRLASSSSRDGEIISRLGDPKQIQGVRQNIIPITYAWSFWKLWKHLLLERTKIFFTLSHIHIDPWYRCTGKCTD